MLRLAAVLLLVSSSLQGAEITLNRAVQVLVQVESAGRKDAVGDAGAAYGILQMHSIMIQDYNRIANADLQHGDAFSPEVSHFVCRTVLMHYLQDIENPTLKHIAFIWNGGGGARHRVEHPIDDAKQRNLEIYYAKVLSAYKTQSNK